jgi:glycosyltransferase involved in cell wall biosynthesis
MKQALGAKIAETQPDIVHFHNTFMSISPAAYYACQEAGVPVVQTLHNYRLICPQATLLRNGRICTECVTAKSLIPALRYKCYRDSRLHTAGVVAMLGLHRLFNTWDQQIDMYICLSKSGRQQFVDGGINPDKLAIKGNFLRHDPGFCDMDDRYFIFTGRLTSEKGLLVLLEAWKQLPDIPLKIVGDGLLRESLERMVASHGMTNVELLGYLPREEALQLVRRASAQIVPSQWLEPFGLVAIEAFACGTPVIASDIGALSEIVEDDVTGYHFVAQEPASMREKVRNLWEQPEKQRAMGADARRTYEKHYTDAVNYRRLMTIYENVLRRRLIHA